MIVLGVSAFYHDSACCLLRDGRLLAAAQEERFTRRKYDRRLPVGAFRYCLEEAGCGVQDLDLVAYYESPALKHSRQRWMQALGPNPLEGAELPDPAAPHRALRDRLGIEAPIRNYDHHRSHAASSYYYSGFSDAAILTVDGVGEWATTTLSAGRGNTIETLLEVSFPHSLGLFYSALTSYLGFDVNGGEAKVMGLAAYGEPSFVQTLRDGIRFDEDGRFELDQELFANFRGPRMFTESLSDRLEGPPRLPGEPLEARHRNIARSAQVVLEESLLRLVCVARQRVDSSNLCLAGGVALNGVANGRLRRSGLFQRQFVPPAPGDAGACLGAAALASVAALNQRPEALTHSAFGPRFSNDTVAALSKRATIPASDRTGGGANWIEEVAERLALGQVIGWFQGRMELGPRALGSRSLLASPLDPAVRDRLNREIKGREEWRPFGPCVLESKVGEYLDLDAPSPFMMETCRLRERTHWPAVTHIDGSTRPQTVDPRVRPRLAELLTAFEARTGCPALLNTSFNRAGEPIVCTPLDAIRTFALAGFDALVLEDLLIDRDDLPEDLPPLLRARERGRGSIAPSEGERRHLYTFV